MKEGKSGCNHCGYARTLTLGSPQWEKKNGLVVYLPSEKYKLKSVGIMTFPTEWKNNIYILIKKKNDVPNHQPENVSELTKPP